MRYARGSLVWIYISAAHCFLTPRKLVLVSWFSGFYDVFQKPEPTACKPKPNVWYEPQHSPEMHRANPINASQTEIHLKNSCEYLRTYEECILSHGAIYYYYYWYVGLLL